MTEQSLRIVFAGTPAFAASHLSKLIDDGLNIVAAYTQPDRPVGRGKKIQPTPVKQVAETAGIPVFQPEKLGPEETDQLITLAPDIMIVVAYGLILGKQVLQTPRFGCINVHASLLPRWRGAAPIERAILAGDIETGVSIMQMDEGLDTGDVLLKLATPINTDDNAQTLTERLLTLGCRGLVEVLQDLPAFQAGAQKQDGSLAVYAAKLGKEDALIHWQNPALTIQHQVQAFFPRSPAYCWYKGERLRIIKAQSTDEPCSEEPGTILEKRESSVLVACGGDSLEINTIQLPGKKPSPLKAVFNGRPDLLSPGESLANRQAL